MNKFLNRNKLWIIIFSAVFITGFATVDSDIYFKISKSIDTFGKIYREVSLNYVDDINPEGFVLAGIKGMLSSLDPYTVYIDETMKKDLDVVTKGKYGGIGTSVGLRRGKVTILDLMEGYPAQRQGLRVGDVISKVDSTNITKENYYKLSNYLKGEPGKIITLTIERDGVEDSLIFQLAIEEIIIKNVTYYGFVPKESNNAYIKLSGFSRSSGSEVKDALIKLKNQKKINSIVLDLRGNPGGLLDQAIDISEKFLNKNDLIVSVMGRDTTKVSKYFAEEVPLADSSKLIVLIDGGSASASEIVTGAIKDHDRGVVVGERSFGKGLVQTILPLSFTTSLKITTAKYYTPSGRCIQEIDYSKNEDIFNASKNKKITTFFTDNKREVFADGGITPDSVVSNTSQSHQIKILLARGLFFQFATNYFNTNNVTSIDSLDESHIYLEFLDYLSKHKFDYTSQSEKLLSELEKIAKKEEMPKDVLSIIDSLESKYKSEKMTELKKYKQEILCKIKEELAARISGREGRVLQSLKKDKQFSVALDVLNNTDLYNKLLGVNN